MPPTPQAVAVEDSHHQKDEASGPQTASGNGRPRILVQSVGHPELKPTGLWTIYALIVQYPSSMRPTNLFAE
jgi:hypothetical protein